MSSIASSTNATYQFGPFLLNAGTREIRNGSDVCRAQPKVFDLLLILLENRSRVVSRQELLKILWPRAGVSRGALPQSMLKLRRLLGGELDSQQWIASARGVGYRFVGEVRELRGIPSTHSVENTLGTPVSRPNLTEDEVMHRVNVLFQQGREQTIRLDHEGLRQTIESLSDRRTCGADPRSRVFSRVLGSVLDRHSRNLDKAWQTLHDAEQLAEQLGDPTCQLAVFRAKGSYFLQFVSYGEAIPWFRRAFDMADRHGADFERADCAFFLAACFGRAGDEPSCKDWTQRASELALKAKPTWLWTYVRSSLAGTQVHLGERALDEGDVPRARLHWGQALQMLDEAEAAGDIDQLGRFAMVLPINRAWARAYLHPDQRSASIEILRNALETESLPQLQLSHLLGLATFLAEEGHLEEAQNYCDEGIALGDSTRIFRHREGFLSCAAEISTRQGRHADAVRQLRILLRWQDETARADALRVAKVTALRLQTERALARLQAERNFALQLQSENADLRREARQRDAESSLEYVAGCQAPSVFRNWLVQSQAQARLEGRPLTLIVIGLKFEVFFEFRQRRENMSSLASALAECLSSHLRSGDRWTLLDSGQLLLALPNVELDQAKSASLRIRRELASSRPISIDSKSIDAPTLLDVALEPDMESTWERITRTGGQLEANDIGCGES